MWLWIKRWRDWAMRELWPMHRLGLRPQAMHFSYEKAGLTLAHQPIPWNAEAILVEAQVRLTAGLRRKSDFQLRLAGNTVVPAESLRREDACRYRVFFRLPPLPESTTAELLWRDRAVPGGQIALPVLRREEFLQQLRLQMPTLSVRLGEQSVACQTFVSTQGKGLIASALLASPTSLAPLADLELRVEFRAEPDGPAVTVPVPLTSTQLAGRQALVTVLPRLPKRIGVWTATWFLADQLLVSQKIRAISQRQFVRSLRLSDTRFVIRSAKQGIGLRRQLPPLEPNDHVGPCFLVSSREPGMAGMCVLEVCAQLSGKDTQPLRLQQEVLITDGPSVVAPGLVSVADLAHIHAFELRRRDKVLGVLPLSPAPTATFTSEGGFRPPEHFVWSAAAEEELQERLARLLEGSGPPV
ncbi:MAG: hypothetical protein NZ700_10400 [Gemmataceae bacterium]|nr:hypothetical protein [Gemmataceae bacterium]MDW8266721.1 hypothetical protein [Gemmataceae bacterium]